MTFTSFLLRLITLSVLMFGLFYVLHIHAVGIENLIAFAVGFFSLSVLVTRFTEGANSAFPIPGHWLPRCAFFLFMFMRFVIVMELAENAHFISAFMLMVVTISHWSEFVAVKNAERELKELMAETSGAAFAPPLARTDDGTTTLEKLYEPDNRVGFKPIYGGVALGQP